MAKAVVTSHADARRLDRVRLHRWLPPALLIGCLTLSTATIGVLDHAHIAATVGLVMYAVVLVVLSALVEGRRRALDRLVATLVYGAFGLALVPLVSVLATVLVNGLKRFDLYFLTYTMRGVFGGMDAGGAYHAIVGTLLITGFAAVISVPIGLLAAIYLVEYGRGRLAPSIRFFVDVMTGIPSIVAGLFAYGAFATLFGPGIRLGVIGSVALSVLMTPVVIRSCEEMLRLVPNDLREASYALGVPPWLTVCKVVLPTAMAGIATGVMLAVARVIGEAAPLLLVTGVVSSANHNLFDGRMMSLPVFVFRSYSQGLAPSGITTINYERAWAAALTLILIVMALNLLARLISRLFVPGR
jgi:phosphate transport system permease protein